MGKKKKVKTEVEKSYFHTLCLKIKIIPGITVPNDKKSDSI